MQLTVAFSDSEVILAVDVSTDMSVKDLGAYVLEESGFKVSGGLEMYHHNRKLDPDATLSTAGLNDNDVVLAVTGPDESVQESLNSQIEAARQQILYNPEMFTQLSQRMPDLAAAIHDPETFREAYTRAYGTDARSAEQQAIDQNLALAMEEMPEAFAPVTMLFASIEVNGHPVKAFVDSGAQTTIMSPECAEKCELSHLIDKRHRGMAYGVGQAKILGRIHMAPVKIGSSFFPCAITVIEGTNIDFLMGLDALYHHRAIIDLKRNLLIVGKEEVLFLPESEIPKSMFPEDAQPNTTNGDNLPQRRPQSNPSQLKPGASAPAPKGANFDSESISTLMKLGFSREQAVRALEQTGGNVELAASLLFG